MTNMNREEFLFWRHIDALVTLSETPETNGFGYCRNKEGEKVYTGLVYRDLQDVTYFCPLLRLGYYISSKGFYVRITTNYGGCSEKTQKELESKIPEFSTLYETTFTWNNFVFDELINWIARHNEWDTSRFKK